VESSRTADVTRGVIVPLVLVVVIVALGIVTGEHAVYLAMLGAAPMLAAVFAGTRLTVIVAVVTLVAALALGFFPGGEEFSGVLTPLVGTAVLSVIAVIASGMKRAPEAPMAVSVERRKTGTFQLQTQANLDSMTGLLNRRGAIRVLGPRNTGPERVIAFLDCDLFKSVNEEYGSDVGDEFLQAIAGRLRHRLPAHDTVARWDGDEFLLAIAADGSSARPALERLVSGINGTNIRTTAGPVPATVSVGAAIWRSGQDLEDVISRSGRALYAAKNGGRGKIVVDEGQSAAPAEGSVPEVQEMES
jgi:diguanylate cyclase (GGDEF)-like protein